MRSAFFVTPKHYSKVCDVAAESVVQLYTNTNELYYSDVFSYIVNNTLYVCGWVSSNIHFSYDEIKYFISNNIDVELPIVLSIEQKELINDIITIGSGTFLGYSTNENVVGLPFEQVEVKKLTKFIYDRFGEAMRVQITINGQQIDVCIECDYDNKGELEDVIVDFLKNKGYMQKIIKVKNINKNIVYKSGDNFISNTYGPRSPYSNTQFIGIDVNRNYKWAHLVTKEIADRYIVNNNLNYSLIELTYSAETEKPIQFAIKGNKGGIHIENGTFFEYLSDYGRVNTTKNTILDKIKQNPIGLIEMAKWGYFDYK
jgi:S-adenosylmethionine synthetase